MTRLFLRQQRTTEECFIVETKWCWHWNIYERLKITDLHHKSIASRLFRQSRSSDVDVSRNFYSIRSRVFVEYTLLSKMCTYFMSVMLARYCLFGSDAGKIMNIWLALFQVSTARAQNEDCQFTCRTGKHLSLWRRKPSMVEFVPQS